MKASFFDLDGTLTKENASYLFIRYLYQKGAISIFTLSFAGLLYLLYIRSLISLKKLHHLMFDTTFSNMSVSDLSDHLEDFITINVSTMFNPIVKKRLNEAIEEGQYVSILSSSPSFLVERIASHLGIEQSVSTVYDVGTEGNLAHIQYVVDGQYKLQVVKALMLKLNLNRGDITAYSDSYDDVHLLSFVGKAVVVSPDAKLRKFAKLKGWEFIK